MTIRHHPDDETLAAYAAGALDLGRHVAVATHLKACGLCRGWARSLERLGGALLAETSPAPMADGALAETLARLDEPAHLPPALKPMSEEAPAALPRFVRAYRFGRWRRIVPSIAMRPIQLPEPSPTRVFLLKAAAGARVIEHEHTGVEMTCVLSGAFRQEDGLYGPGDFEIGDENDRHELKVEAEEECLCLIALQGELRWRGLLGRLLQSFIRV